MALSKANKLFTTKLNAFKLRTSNTIRSNLVLRTILIRFPQIGGGLMSAVKASGADYFAQTQVDRVFDPSLKDKPKPFDYTRNFLFALLGFVHGGFINFFMHSVLNPYLFGTAKNVSTIAKSILFTQLVYTPCFAFPIFYGFRGLVYNNYSVYHAKESIKLYLNGNWKTDIPMAMRIWAPAHCITYTLIPLRYRIFWINIVSFAWTTILSANRGKVTGNEKETMKQNLEKSGKSNKVINNTPKISEIQLNTGANSNNNGARDGVSGMKRRGATRQDFIEISNNRAETPVGSGGGGGGITEESIDANNNIIDPGNRVSPILKKSKNVRKEN